MTWHWQCWASKWPPGTQLWKPCFGLWSGATTRETSPSCRKCTQPFFLRVNDPHFCWGMPTNGGENHHQWCGTSRHTSLQVRDQPAMSFSTKFEFSYPSSLRGSQNDWAVFLYLALPALSTTLSSINSPTQFERNSNVFTSQLRMEKLMGWLAGSVGGAGNSWSQDYNFEPHTGCRETFKTNKWIF